MLKNSLIRRGSGFTIIELMMAMTAFSLFTLTITLLLRNGLATFNRAKILTELNQDVKKAIDLIAVDVRSTVPGSSTGSLNYVQWGDSNGDQRCKDFRIYRYSRRADEDTFNDYKDVDSVSDDGGSSISVEYWIVYNSADGGYMLMRDQDGDYMVILENVLLGETPSDPGTITTYESYFKASKINSAFQYGDEAPYPTMEIRLKAGRFFKKDFLTCTMHTACACLNRGSGQQKPLHCSAFTHLIDLKQPLSERAFLR
ncbi:hypothetical protein IJT10_04115 [bacterium]|nr:hypothetical protein [bacterium]